MAKRVSVVVPVYNGELHLADTLRSVLAQTLRPFEVFVVDDGSTDSTAAIAASFDGVSLVQVPNGGVAAARNAGAQRSTGDFLAFVDHDDLWRPEKLARQVEEATKPGASPFATCHLKYFFEGPIPRWFRGPTDGTPAPGFVPSCWLVERPFFDRTGGFDPAHGHGCDTDWIARVQDLGVAPNVLDDCLVDYRVHGGNASQDATQFRQRITGVLRAKVHRFRETAE